MPGRKGPGRAVTRSNRGSVAAWATAVAVAAARTLTCLGLVDLEAAALEVLAIERLHGAGGISVGHLDEAEAAGPAGVAIIDQRDRFNGSMLREQRAHGLFGRRKGQITYE